MFQLCSKIISQIEKEVYEKVFRVSEQADI